MFLTNLHKKDAFLAELLAYIIYFLTASRVTWEKLQS